MCAAKCRTAYSQLKILKKLTQHTSSKEHTLKRKATIFISDNGEQGKDWLWDFAGLVAWWAGAKETRGPFLCLDRNITFQQGGGVEILCCEQPSGAKLDCLGRSHWHPNNPKIWGKFQEHEPGFHPMKNHLIQKREIIQK